MELICPSCEARYQVPETSIGEKGRQVSCMNCGHSWHAFPPLILDSSATPATTASPGIDYQTPPQPGRSSPGLAHTEQPEASDPIGPSDPLGALLGASGSGAPATPAGAEASAATRATEPSRSERLAEIREMLAEVQSEERAAATLMPDQDERTRIAPQPRTTPLEAASPAPTPHPAATGVAGTQPVPMPAPPPESLSSTDDEDTHGDDDPLRRRLATHVRGTETRRTDLERLRRRHDRRARRSQRARGVGSGAFLTGFLLVVIVAAAMTAIYILHPQIIARMPGTEQMMNEYVATVDDVRVAVAESFENVRAWMFDLTENGG